MSRLIYHLDRMLLAGAPVVRWIDGLLLFVGAMGAFGLVPGRFFATGLCLVLLVGFFLLRRHWHSRDYVQFREAPPPAVTPQPMAPSDSVPIHASGYFTVEEKSERFTWIQGYLPHIRDAGTCCHLSVAAQTFFIGGVAGKRSGHVVRLLFPEGGPQYPLWHCQLRAHDSTLPGNRTRYSHSQTRSFQSGTHGSGDGHPGFAHRRGYTPNPGGPSA